MSKLLWHALLLPDLKRAGAPLVDEPYRDTLGNTRVYEKANSEITIPDAKAFRAMSRASLFVAHLCEQAAGAMEPFLSKSPFSIGVYCAVENGPIDAPSTVKIVAGDPNQFAEVYRKHRNPKMYLKQLPNLVPAQMGIFMGIQGPMNVYTHSHAAGVQALEQAEWDLRTGAVEAALVCSSHAFDDFLVVKRSYEEDAKGRTLTEAAGAILLGKDTASAVTDWTDRIREDRENFFGIADPIVNILRNL